MDASMKQTGGRTNLIQLFGLNFTNASLKDAVELIIEAATRKDKLMVVTPNVDHVILLSKDEKLRTMYRKAAFTFPDGMPLVWFSRLLPAPFRLKERVTGADLVVILLKRCGQISQSISVVGGEPGKEAEILLRLREFFPDTEIKGVIAPPFGFENDPTQSSAIIEQLNQWQADHLFVGVGFPKQEKFITDHWEELNFHTAMGVGAAVDLALGYKKRAPRWIQKIGFEWFWRFLQEPGRLFNRYFVRDAGFIPLAWSEFLQIRKQQK